MFQQETICHACRHHHVLTLGLQPNVTLSVEVANTREPAYEPKLFVAHHRALSVDMVASEVGATYESSEIKLSFLVVSVIIS